MKYIKGFSLVEILITVVLFGFLGTVATATLFAILGGSAKTEITKVVKQNGDYALSIMETKIRNSKISDSNCGSTSYKISLTSISDNILYDIRCQAISGQNRLYYYNFSGSYQYLTSTDVVIDNCAAVFKCAEVNNIKTVTINFKLSQKSPSVSQSEKSSQVFNTEITLRNN